ncbi:MAG TPA: MFS transporter [Candidatus Limnocylindria bacterium]|nr:MFS transporter [Candidatus Limnocylindria bacterium]
MIVIGLVGGLILGLLAGGKIGRLLDVRLRWVALILLALLVRYGTQTAIANGVDLAEQLRLPLYAGAFGVLALGLWLNRRLPGMLAVFVGVVANGVAIVANGGWMPVWPPALDAVGFTQADLNAGFHVLLPTDFGADFFLHAGPIADIIPIPLPYLTNVSSVGDAFIAAGLAWFVFATLLRGKEDPQGGVALGPGRAVVAQTGLGLERPIMLGGGVGPGLSEPQPFGARVRGHPYIRLALDARFAAYWLAQTISLFGDRLHQVALGVLVYAVTNSPLATGLVFLAATLPNILLGPIAGTFVDRWEHKRVMIASDLIRAVLVIAIPFVAQMDVVYVYPLVFVITAVSLFFRPAKVALLPRIVKEDDVMAANSATWTADTLADILGFPIAGLFVAFLGTGASQLGMAFFADSATYVLSALLLAGVAVAPLVRDTAPRAGNAVRNFLGEVGAGWRFLRGEAALMQNTLISALAQLTVGVTLALTVVYARDALDGTVIPYPGNYAAIDTAIGIGNLVGGFAVGLIGARLRKGWLVVGGFIVMGIGTIVFGLTGNVVVALVAATVVGIANLVYIIPTQTMFIEKTPIELLGRVIAFRSTLVFGSMTLAMGVAGIIAESVPVGLVIAGFGAITLLGGVIGAFLPAVRDA